MAIRQKVNDKRGSVKRKNLYLRNYDRLKYETVHVIIGRAFIPSVIGIVNEDPYI